MTIRRWCTRQIILKRKKSTFLGLIITIILIIVLNRRHALYTEYDNIELPTSESFSCSESTVPGECVVKMTRLSDARWMCRKHILQCAGFVFNSGTKMVSLKKSFSGTPQFAPGIVTGLNAQFARKLSPHLETEECAAEISKDKAGLKTSSQSDMKCKLVGVDPWDPAVMKLIHNKEEMDCKGSMLTSLNKSTLTIDDNADVSEVQYKTIRGKPHDDFAFIYGKTGTLKRGSQVKVDDDAVQVVSYNKATRKQVDFHLSVQPKSEVLARPATAQPGIALNILLLGFDSTSHAHFARKLPDIYKQLKDDPDTYVFKGYGIVGDGTTPALAAMLAGGKEDELPEARRSQPEAKCVDDWPFLFKSLSKEYGYATMYAEDQPTFSSFWYRLLGFCEPPVDHYARPFWLAVKSELKDEGLDCVGAEPGFRKSFEYLKSFYKGYPGKLKFSFTFLCLGHEDFNGIGYTKKDLSSLLRLLKSEGFMDRTMLVLFGDHGLRYGAIRSTMVGKLEERLPFLSISLPPWFRQKYPDLAKNLKTNTERLTTPFDLHATIKHLVSFPNKISTKYGKSLFEEIEKSRSCADSAIPEHFCPCMNWKVVNSSHHHIQQIAEAAVQQINSLISGKNLQEECSSLELQGVASAVKVVGGEEFQTFEKSADMDGRVVAKGERPQGTCHYQLQIRTSPNNGIYEVTGHIINKAATVNPEMSRLDQYGDQPKCIMDRYPLMRKYCYCKDQ